MRPHAVTSRDVEAVAREVLGQNPVAVEYVPIGFGNHNWRVRTDQGGAYVLKIGPSESARKWNSARHALELAAAAGVPTPRLVHFSEREDRVIRVFEWIDALPLSAIAQQSERVARFATELAAALASLHLIEMDAFSSRLDASAPSFEQWTGYVEYRLRQIRDRSIANDALDSSTLDRASDVITELAREVNAVARPSLCHRDLQPDNLLVDATGRLAGVLDWDMAELWDPAAEWFKLDWMLFPSLPGGEAVFDAAYRKVHADLPQWEQRKKLVDLMESLNAVANAAGDSSNRDYEARARVRLQALLDSR